MKSKGACKNDEEEQCKTLIELAVNLESILDGKRVKEIQWPKECLIVSIKRGEKEIIPKGEVRIKAGDYIVVLCEASYEREIKYALGELCYKNIEF
ncbi:TrkA C-terminal domain-containing protein [Desnuesiella massiliensis]|uniref:TrkA C-terminal domain-containing protein n=1 Tax=Desnuesiella massiliensis TaxID=1650662 RepID=UPI0006E3098B|nr:TrkA C-terminal domain-containing protein [Desnuesiella massiliensis]